MEEAGNSWVVIVWHRDRVEAGSLFREKKPSGSDMVYHELSVQLDTSERGMGNSQSDVVLSNARGGVVISGF